MLRLVGLLRLCFFTRFEYTYLPLLQSGQRYNDFTHQLICCYTFALELRLSLMNNQRSHITVLTADVVSVLRAQLCRTGCSRMTETAHLPKTNTAWCHNQWWYHTWLSLQREMGHSRGETSKNVVVLFGWSQFKSILEVRTRQNNLGGHKITAKKS